MTLMELLLLEEKQAVITTLYVPFFFASFNCYTSLTIHQAFNINLVHPMH